jgi:RNA polymerase sigma-70 factor (ECF subfamily)
VDVGDRALVEGLRARKGDAFDALYRCHRHRIWAFLARLTGSKDEAEELFQDTWLAVAGHAHALPEDSALLPWLYTIARNKHRNARRARLFDFRRRQRAATEPVPAVARPDELAATRARAAELAAAFARLSAPQREIVLLCLVEALDTSEVGAILGLRDDAVRKRLSRARADLAQLLEQRNAAPKGRHGGSP